MHQKGIEVAATATATVTSVATATTTFDATAAAATAAATSGAAIADDNDENTAATSCYHFYGCHCVKYHQDYVYGLNKPGRGLWFVGLRHELKASCGLPLSRFKG